MQETERAVIACVMEDNSLMHVARSLGLTGPHFGSVTNRLLWDTLVDMSKKQVPIDLITLRDQLTSTGSLEKVGGMDHLAMLDIELPDPGNFKAYVDSVKSAAVRRKVVEVGKQFARIPEGTFTTDQILKEMQDKVGSVVSLAESSLRITTIESAVNSLVEELENGLDQGLETGFYALDGLLGGLRPGNLVIVAGRPGMGKTSLATNMMHYQASMGVPAGIFSLEMSAQELGMRLLSDVSEVPHQKIKMGALGQAEWDSIAKARREIAKLPIIIEDSGGLDIDKLAAKASELKNMHGLSVIYVDYIQLMQAQIGDRSGSRVNEVSVITRGLKNLARQLGIPIVALSQLSREVEKRRSKRPVLADLRDSGSIEQDADAVVFVYREGYYKVQDGKEDTTNGITEINVAKNRSGPPGTIHLVWEDTLSRFVNPQGF